MDGVTTCKYETLHNVTFEDIKHVPDNDHVITLAVLRKTILNFIRKERTWLEYLNMWDPVDKLMEAICELFNTPCSRKLTAVKINKK